MFFSFRDVPFILKIEIILYARIQHRSFRLCTILSSDTLSTLETKNFVDKMKWKRAQHAFKYEFTSAINIVILTCASAKFMVRF